MKYLITGAAGFIGSNLVDRLLQEGHEVIGFDNLSTGKRDFLKKALNSPKFTFIKGDLLDKKQLSLSMANIETVFHLAANADVRFGTHHPHKDLEQNTLATFNVLEAMRSQQVKRIVFASTGSIYGESPLIPTPEDAPFPIQTSLYGASKLAAEGLIQAYCEGFDFTAYLFRFVSILGERYTHGHVFDFYQQLLSHPEKLFILGNGKQRKSYLHVSDCIEAILIALEKKASRINIFNLGTDEYCEVDQSIDWMCDHLKLQPKRHYTGQERGWIGDNPFIYLATAKIRSLGWSPKFTIQAGVLSTLRYLEKNRDLLDRSDKQEKIVCS